MGMFAGALSGATPILFYLVMGNLIDSLSPTAGKWKLTPDQVQEAVGVQALYLLLIAIASGLTNGFMSFANGLASERVGTKIKSRYFQALVKQEIGYFDLKKTGTFLNNLTEDVLLIEQVYSIRISQLCQYMTQSAVGLGLAFRASWRMSLVLLGTAPIIVALFTISGQLVMFLSKKVEMASSDALSIASEIVQAMKTVRSMNGEGKEISRYNLSLRSVNLLSLVKGLSNAVSAGLGFFAIWGACALTFYYGGWLISWKLLSLGELIQVFGNLLFAIIGLGLGFSNLPPMIKSINIQKLVSSVIWRKPVIRYEGGEKIQYLKGDIELKNVSFFYPTRPTQEVMNNFSISIKSGEKVALVGASGSGKSTTIGILERFYEYKDGEVTIDDVDIRKLDPKWLHQVIGIVTQEPTLFATTIRENILYGIHDKNTVKQEDIERVAKAANAHDFIVKLDKGYDTMVGERGSTLSGGQKQRIAIARAMLQDPKILLLDEATSALDTESEHIVQDALNKLMEGRTCIIVAHRLATIKDSNKIFVIDHGKVVENGTHDELLKLNGVYSGLASRQMAFGNKEDKKEEIPVEDRYPHIETTPKDDSIPPPHSANEEIAPPEKEGETPPDNVSKDDAREKEPEVPPESHQTNPDGKPEEKTEEKTDEKTQDENKQTVGEVPDGNDGNPIESGPK